MSRIFLSPPDMSGRERELVGEVFDSNYVAPAGPMIPRFERMVADYMGIAHASAATTATAALHLAVRVLDIGPGDEVWAASPTFIGGIAPITYERATPVFFDCAAESWTIDPALIEEEAERANRENRLPKAIVTTDLYGQSADLDPLLAVCRRYGIRLIADSAEALGARYKDRHAGKGADVAIMSFNGNKIITTSGGGMLLSDDPELVRRATYLGTQARQPVAHYEHIDIGHNYRMSNVSAAIGVGQMEMVEQKVERRRAIFDAYREAFADIDGFDFMPEPNWSRSSHWLTTLTVDPARAGVDRHRIIDLCTEAEIEVRPLWKPMHMQPVFRDARYVGGDVGVRLFENGICLPSGSGLTQAQQERVVEVVRAAAGR